MNRSSKLITLGLVIGTLGFSGVLASTSAQVSTTLRSPLHRHATVPHGMLEYTSDLYVITEGSNIVSAPTSATIERNFGGGFVLLYDGHQMAFSRNARIRIARGAEKIYRPRYAPVPQGLTNPTVRVVP